MNRLASLWLLRPAALAVLAPVLLGADCSLRAPEVVPAADLCDTAEVLGSPCDSGVESCMRIYCGELGGLDCTDELPSRVVRAASLPDLADWCEHQSDEGGFGPASCSPTDMPEAVVYCVLD